MRLNLIAAFLLAVSCKPAAPYYTHESHRHIGADFRERAAAFILQCATAANPHSDEEGEDLVLQCERTATRLYGRTTSYCVVHIPGRNYPLKYRCDSDVNDSCKRVCGR